MKLSKKILAGILAVFVVLSSTACDMISVKTQKLFESEETSGTPGESSPDDGRGAAYQKVIQQIVNKYGVFGSDKAHASFDLNAGTNRGFAKAETVDLTGDDKDELFVVYIDNNIHMNVYEYENGAAQKKWSDVAMWTGVFSLSINKNDEVVIWTTYESVGTPRKMYTYKDGRYCVADGHEIEGYYSIGSNSNPEGIMLGALANKLGIEDEYYAGAMEEIMSYSCQGTLESADQDILASRWGIKAVEPKLSAFDILGNIKYYGDISKCKMSKEMALAYAEAIKSKMSVTQGNSGEQFELYAALMDLSGDGMPILVTVIASVNNKFVFPMDGKYSIYLWTWGGSSAREYDYNEDLNLDMIDGMVFTSYQGDGRIYINEGFRFFDESTFGWLDYKVSNGQISLSHHETVYAASIDVQDSDFAFCEDFPGADSERYENGIRVARVSDLIDAGWIMGEVSPQSGSRYLYIRKVNGNIVKFNNYESYKQWNVNGYSMSGDVIELFDNMAGELYLKDNVMTPAASAIELLSKYSEVAGKPSYSYDDVYEILSDSAVEKIAKKVAKQYDGEIGEIYKLNDDLYYVIIYTDGKVSGTVIVKNTKNGNEWKIIRNSENPLGEEELSKEVNKDSQTPNIKIDFGRVDEGVNYIKEVLGDIDGTVVNPGAKEELVKFIDASISRCTGSDVKAKKNVIKISGKEAKKAANKAAQMYNEYKELLNKNNIILNKPITVIIQFAVKDADIKKPVQIKLTKDILGAINSADGINIALEGSSCGVKVTRDSLEKIISNHGEITVILQSKGDDNYIIQFADSNGDIIEKLCEPVKFTVPASNELCTIQAEYTGGVDNWGGQYDAVNGTLVFDTIYSGTYTVLDKKIDISDIGSLTKEEQKAIRFMVSKGFFELNDKDFNPDGSLTRYAFAKALVKMCFALDNDDKTDLLDMKKDDPYYPYVASGETKGIIEGYDDKMFHGNDEALREEVIALCSRTLEKRKGYTRPEVPWDYLHFADNGDIVWGHEEIALAVREALIEDGGNLNPQTPTNRKDAALILYRLFMLLHEVEPVAIKATSSSGGFTDVLFPVLGVLAVIAAVGGIVVVVIIKKKKKSAASVVNGSETNNNR